MDPRRRDGLLAAVALVVLAGAGTGTGTVGVGVFTSPGVVAFGVVGALAVEVLFLRYPERLLAAWERPGVPAAATVVLLVAGGGALMVAPWLVAAVCWGLATYLALLAPVLAGVGNPLAPLAR